MVDRIRPLKIEDTGTGSALDMFPTEANPAQDYVSVKGVSLEGSNSTLITGDSGTMKFQDIEIAIPATLKDAIERLKQKNVDLTNLFNGYVLTWNTSLNTFELQPSGGAGGGSGVTPPFFFSKSGNASVGTYLRVGESVTSNTGMTIVGTNKIVKIVASNGSNVGSNTVVQIQKRTAVNTFVDLAGASITIPSGSYTATISSLSITLGLNEELSAYVKSGSTLDNPIVGVYVIPA